MSMDRMHTSPSQLISSLVTQALAAIDVPLTEPVSVEKPAHAQHGDYATSVALTLFSKRKSDPEFTARFAHPRALAGKIVQALTASLNDDDSIFSEVTVAGAGFVNFTVRPGYLMEFARSLVKNQAKLPRASETARVAIIEYLGPNTNKPLHIGHLRNGALGLSLGRLLTETGWQVHFATINNDRGLHIMKSVWGYLEFARKEEDSEAKPWTTALHTWQIEPELWLTPSEMVDEHLKKPDHFVGHWYKLADTYAENPDVLQAWSEMLQTWEDANAEHHAILRILWKKLNDWFYEGYQQTAATLDISFSPEYVSYESDLYQAGKNIVLSEAEKGTFKTLPDGAIKVELEHYNLPDKVLLRRDGTGIYMTFDLELTRQRAQHRADKLIWVVGVDQQLYFQQLFAVCEMLGYGKREDFFHFAYGMVRLPEGKMSSRKGTAIYADDLIEISKTQAEQEMMETNIAKSFSQLEKDKVIEAVAVGAVKWSMLSQDPLSEITFDVQESVSFKGFAGPYIQYTAARCHSVIDKANSTITKPFDILLDTLTYSIDDMAAEEVVVLRNLITYFDVVERAAENHEPHAVAVYVFELAQAFNAFYAQCPIVVTDAAAAQQTTRRLLITAATEAVIRRCLFLLGITAVEKM